MSFYRMTKRIYNKGGTMAGYSSFKPTQDLIDRLGDYEDIGMSPGEIRETIRELRRDKETIKDAIKTALKW